MRRARYAPRDGMPDLKENSGGMSGLYTIGVGLDAVISRLHGLFMLHAAN